MFLLTTIPPSLFFSHWYTQITLNTIGFKLSLTLVQCKHQMQFVKEIHLEYSYTYLKGFLQDTGNVVHHTNGAKGLGLHYFLNEKSRVSKPENVKTASLIKM